MNKADSSNLDFSSIYKSAPISNVLEPVRTKAQISLCTRLYSNQIGQPVKANLKQH